MVPARYLVATQENFVAEGAITDLRPDELGGARLVAAGVEEALERFSDPELLASGRVNVISLETVEKRFGMRWDARKDQVYDFTERVLERGVGTQGFFLRVSGSDFFIVHPEL